MAGVRLLNMQQPSGERQAGTSHRTSTSALWGSSQRVIQSIGVFATPAELWLFAGLCSQHALVYGDGDALQQRTAAAQHGSSSSLAVWSLQQVYTATMHRNCNTCTQQRCILHMLPVHPPATASTKLSGHIHINIHMIQTVIVNQPYSL